MTVAALEQVERTYKTAKIMYSLKKEANKNNFNYLMMKS